DYVVTHFLRAVPPEEDGAAAAGWAAGAVAPTSRAAGDVPDGMIPLLWATSPPAGTGSPVTQAGTPAAPAPAHAPDSPPLGAPPPDAVAAPVLRRAPQRPGAGPVSDGLLDDRTAGAALEPAWWPGAD